MRSFAFICVALSLVALACAGDGPKVTDKVSNKIILLKLILLDLFIRMLIDYVMNKKKVHVNA